MSRPRRGAGEGGFTLMELLVVVAIVAILISVATISFGEYRERTRVEMAREEIVSLLQQARLRALSQQLSQSVVFDYANDTVTDALGNAHSFENVTLDDFVCGSCSVGGSTTETINFNPSGSATVLTMRVSSGAVTKVAYILVNSVTGRVDVREQCSGGSCT